jgi:hypothetical protein
MTTKIETPTYSTRQVIGCCHPENRLAFQTWPKSSWCFRACKEQSDRLATRAMWDRSGRAI